MTVKLHKVTVFVVDGGDGCLNDESDGLAQLQGDMAHNSGSRIVEIQTAEFDREWSDDDPLNQTATMDDRALLESLIKPDIPDRTGSDGKSLELGVLLDNIHDVCPEVDTDFVALMNTDMFVGFYNGMFPDRKVRYTGDDYFERI